MKVKQKILLALTLMLVTIFTVLPSCCKAAGENLSITVTGNVSGRTLSIYKLFDLEIVDGNQYYSWEGLPTKDFFTNKKGLSTIYETTEYLKGLESNSTNLTKLAEEYYNYCEDNNISELNKKVVGENEKQVVFSGLDKGYYLIYDDKVLYYSVEADGMHKIMAYDEKTGMIKEIYSEPYKDSAAEDLVTPNYLYLLGKYSDYLVFMDQSYEQNLQEESGFLVILNLKDKEEIRVRSSYYMEGAYIQAACDKLITSTSDGGYSNLYTIDMKTGEIETISEKCRSTSGDYIKGTDVWQKKLVIIQISEYNRIYDWRNTMNYLTTIEDWSIELAGEWYEQNGCFWGNDLQENTYIITYDGVQYPYDGECKSLNRVDGQYVDYTSDGKIRKLNEETGEWEEWIDCPQWLNFGQR